MFFVYEKQNERREFRRNDNTKGHKKSEGSGERDNTCAQAGKGRPGEYSDRTIVLLYVIFILFRCSSIVEMYKMIEGKKRLLKVIGELPSRQTLSYRLRRLDIEAISRRIIENIKGGTYIIDSAPIKVLKKEYPLNSS